MKDSRSKYDSSNRKPAPSTSKGFGYESKGNIPESQPLTDAAKQWDGWGTALKPAHEPIVVARKPLAGTVAANVLEYGTGALNIDACRIGTDGGCAGAGAGAGGRVYGNGLNGPFAQPIEGLGRWPANVIHDGSEEVVSLFPEAQTGDFSGRRNEPKTKNTFSSFQLRDEVGHRGDSGSAARFFYAARKDEPSAERTYEDNGGTNFAMKPGARRLDEGSPARFFYCAKADKEEREIGCYAVNAQPLAYGNQALAEVKRGVTEKHSNSGMNAVKMRGNTHPTVKPLDLMAYLCRLVTPPGGTVVDCFMGSGSTGIAALRGGFNFIGIEKNPEYVEIARLRLEGDAPLFNREADSGQWSVDSEQPLLFAENCELTTENCELTTENCPEDT
jgi:site-specific DNA-methyltransferase (adenine-specific)